MDWIGIFAINDLGSLKSHIQELKTVRLEAVANLEQHQLPLCQRLISILDEEISNLDNIARNWEEDHHRLLNLEKWLDLVEVEYNDLEECALNDSLADSRTL